MSNTIVRLLARLACGFLLAGLAFALLAAEPAPKQAAAGESFSQEELDGLLGPIALYPDGLLSQVLMASTYPIEIVHADRFVKQNPGLHGEALEKELEKNNWEASVQSLAAYPNVLAGMSEKLEWTVRLGNAFLEDQGRVMDTVQALRRRAQEAGNLKSTKEQTVVREKETIIIQPAQKEVVYVADYSPAVVYGVWWYAAAHSYYGRYYGSYSGSVSVSYSSYRVSASNYGSASANWSGRNVSVQGRESRFSSSAGRAQSAGSAWRHDASHRGGIGYPTSEMRDRFRGLENGARPGAGNRGPANLASGAPASLAGKGSPNGPLQAPRALGSAPSGAPAGPQGGSPFPGGMPSPPSMPAGGPPSLGGGGFPGLPGPPPFPH